MVTGRILMTVEERQRWLDREKKLVEDMKGMTKDERKACKPELESIRNQIKYYDALIRDMKTELKPEGNPIHEVL